MKYRTARFAHPCHPVTPSRIATFCSPLFKFTESLNPIQRDDEYSARAIFIVAFVNELKISLSPLAAGYILRPFPGAIVQPRSEWRLR